jgi:hypothetical protein
MEVKMQFVRVVAITAVCFALVSASNYRIHIKVLPEDVYDVYLNENVKKGTTDKAGVIDFSLENVAKGANPRIMVMGNVNSGSVVLDGENSLRSGNKVDSLSVKKSPNGDWVYDIRFIVDPQLYAQKNNVTIGQQPQNPTASINPQPLQLQRKNNVVFSGGQQVQKKKYSFIGINDNIEYARKISTTGAACFFIGMGINYAAAFIPVTNGNDTSINVGGLLLSLGLSVASGPLEIAGTSYAMGGAKLAWELGEGKCEASNQPFDLWGYYKGGWAFVAIGGAFSVISAFVPKTDQGTALTLSLVGLGLQIGRDVCWSIANVKSLTMTRKLKECLDEQKTPAYRMRLELQPVVVRSGMGLQGTLLF